MISKTDAIFDSMFDTQLKIAILQQWLQLFQVNFTVTFLISLWFGGELGAKLKLSYLVIMNISFVSSSIVDDKVGWSPTYLCALMLLFILFKRRKCNRILKQIKRYPDSEQERKQYSPQNKHVGINHSFLFSLVS